MIYKIASIIAVFLPFFIIFGAYMLNHVFKDNKKIMKGSGIIVAILGLAFVTVSICSDYMFLVAVSSCTMNLGVCILTIIENQLGKENHAPYVSFLCFAAYSMVLLMLPNGANVIFSVVILVVDIFLYGLYLKILNKKEDVK